MQGLGTAHVARHGATLAPAASYREACFILGKSPQNDGRRVSAGCQGSPALGWERAKQMGRAPPLRKGGKMLFPE